MNGQEAALEWRKNGRSWGPSDLDQDVIFMIQFTGFAAKLLEAIDKVNDSRFLRCRQGKVRGDFLLRGHTGTRLMRIAREASEAAGCIRCFAARLSERRT